MYSSYGFREFEIGDVDVIKHKGIYHLFHLTLPNHDYIAHAISRDGLTWRRVKNALFISDPEAWDDDMLWTMHVSPDPYQPGSWRMFYTGLCMRERGRIQRIGLAHSDDLYHWQKDTLEAYPIEVSDEYYEHSLEEGRHWVSFRDPFCFHDNGDVYLLAAARVKDGPIIRRGCVSLARETAENQFEFGPPLYHPRQYDDIEVPNVVKLNDRYYLIGSIREDVKVRYWYANEFNGPYQNFHDNVLLPQGNYAARVCWDEDRYLIWNFFYKGLNSHGQHLMAPPKELVVNGRNELCLKSFSGFEQLASKTLTMSDLIPLQPLLDNPYASNNHNTEDFCSFGCRSGFEAFLMRGDYQDFMLSGALSMEGRGKCGLVFRLDNEGNGYYISLDLFKGIAQIRAWRHSPEGGFEAAFHYEQLQAAFYVATKDPHQFRLIAHEQYLEFSLNGYVLLTLADDQFEQGRVGFYVESAHLRIDDLQLKTLVQSSATSYPEGVANY